MEKITLLALLIIIGAFAASQAVLADNAVLSVSPASLNSVVGAPFNVSVQLNPANNKVCVVMGTLSFNNLACQSITVASGVMAQTAPTCDTPNFTLGIPKCATTAQNLFSVSAKGVQAGQGSLFFAGVKVIGAGADVAFSSQGGAYNIAAAQTTAPKITPKTTMPQVAQPTQQTPQQVETPVQQTTPANNLSANAGAASLVSASSRWFNYFAIALVILVALCGAYYLIKRKKK